ncbi:MAG TPA: FecR domain-containing protein [Rhizomicrobium sp.]|nr:FecR domain-containing protein [Rhizomicrobium sp.]
MSETTSEATGEATSEAREIKRRAAQFVIARRTSEEWSEVDQKALDAWLAERVEHSIAYWRMDAAWESTNRLSILRPQRSEPAPRTSLMPRTAKAVAAIAAVALVAYAAQSEFAPKEKVYASAIGDRKILTLADGSRIELNTDTVLRVAQDETGRKVWLDRGEAYFSIKHDGAHPFVVQVGKHRITDLGTKFVVREAGERVDVSLLEGRARIDAPDAEDKTHSAILMPGDVAVATNNSLSVRKTETRRIENDLAWRTGLLVFNNTTLGEAANAFNRYNNKKLVIENPQTAGLTIDGTFHTNNVGAFVDVVQHVLKLNVKNNQSEIVISP